MAIIESGNYVGGRFQIKPASVQRTVEKCRPWKGATAHMNIWNEYILATSMDEAGQTLQKAQGSTKFVAGGTDLLLEIQQNRHSPVETLVDVSQIPELRKMEIQGEYFFLGAGVPVSQIATSELVLKHASAVATATGLIGGPQVRNSATLGGNVAHALPAADGMIALVAMDAIAVIYCQGNLFEKPILELFRGAGVSALGVADVLVGFKIRLIQKNEASAFDRVMRPQGVALPILNTAVWLRRDENTIADIRIVFGPSGPVPSRALMVESTLRGNVLDAKALSAAKAAIHDTVKFRTSKMRATAEYRYQLAEVLLERVLKTAWNCAEDRKNG